MNRAWKQILVALLLGMMIPRILVTIGGSALTSTGTQENPAPSEEMATQAVEQTEKKICVCVGEGNIQKMELEDYVLGVVLAEMPASFEIEALKAQAVVARTYAMRRMCLGDRHSDGDVCTAATCCQAYISQEDYLQSMGVAQDIAKVSGAVQSTAGQVLTYNEKLAETTYFACSGGRTEDAEAVWGEAIPYLQAVDSPGEESAEAYLQTQRIQSQTLCEALGRKLEANPKNWLGKVTYTDGQGVDYMFIGGVAYSGVELRNRLKLNSTAFTITFDGSDFLIQTKGKGHRVGMSQYGADAMASGGKAYTDILSYYYQGTRIDKNDTID